MTGVHAIPSPPPHALPIAGSEELFPVRRVYCVGRNYADHVVEMGGVPDRSEPFFFQKNPTNLDPSGEFPYPVASKDVHHEAELLVALKAGGDSITLEKALDHVWGYAACLDMTRRDLQAEAKAAGRPWEAAKAFERSAPVGPLHSATEVGHIRSGGMLLKVNGEIRQNADIGQMIWKVPEIVAHLSALFTLAPGDVILTGTPAGVGPVHRGDIMELSIEGLSPLRVDVT